MRIHRFRPGWEWKWKCDTDDVVHDCRTDRGRHVCMSIEIKQLFMNRQKWPYLLLPGFCIGMPTPHTPRASKQPDEYSAIDRQQTVRCGIRQCRSATQPCCIISHRQVCSASQPFRSSKKECCRMRIECQRRRQQPRCTVVAHAWHDGGPMVAGTSAWRPGQEHGAAVGAVLMVRDATQTAEKLGHCGRIPAAQDIARIEDDRNPRAPITALSIIPAILSYTSQ